MQISQHAPRQLPGATHHTSDANPWGFPELDTKIAQKAVAGYEAVDRIAAHLIDRSIAVRVMLDRDIKAGKFSKDTVHAVDLLTRARDYAIDTINHKYLPSSVLDAVEAWRVANKDDDRLNGVFNAQFDVEHVLQDILDDDEGNVRDEIEYMRTEPSKEAWQAVRSSLDGAIGSLYALPGSTQPAEMVLRAAGGIE